MLEGKLILKSEGLAKNRLRLQWVLLWEVIDMGV